MSIEIIYISTYFYFHEARPCDRLKILHAVVGEEYLLYQERTIAHCKKHLGYLTLDGQEEFNVTCEYNASANEMYNENINICSGMWAVQ